jgi:hypothetical protein
MSNPNIEAALAEVQARIIEEDPTAVVPTNPSLAQALNDEYKSILAEEKALGERKEVIRSMLIAMIDEVSEDGQGLVVGDVVAWKRTKETRIYLKNDEIKRRYPQTRYPQFYRETETEVLRQTAEGKNA